MRVNDCFLTFQCFDGGIPHRYEKRIPKKYKRFSHAVEIKRFDDRNTKKYFSFFLQKETPSDIQLHLAAINGDVALLTKLLDSGRVHVDCKDEVRMLCLRLRNNHFALERKCSISCRALRWRIDDVNDSNLFNRWHAVSVSVWVC